MREIGGLIRRDVLVVVKSRCQVCHVMSNSEHFHTNIAGREYRINYSLNCREILCIHWNVLFVVYNILLACMSCRLRFNNYQACSSNSLSCCFMFLQN